LYSLIWIKSPLPGGILTRSIKLDGDRHFVT
jgi:hypothetical protein